MKVKLTQHMEQPRSVGDDIQSNRCYDLPFPFFGNSCYAEASDNSDSHQHDHEKTTCGSHLGFCVIS